MQIFRLLRLYSFRFEAGSIRSLDEKILIIEPPCEKYGTDFTEMDKVLLQIENDYAAKENWEGYAKNNDFKTFMLLFEKDFPEMAVARYE